MNYDRLTSEYRRQQIFRVEAVRAKIAERDAVSSPGRVVPEDAELAIGTGRQLAMAVMFLDICGFSKRQSETLQQQDLVLRTLNLFFTETIRVAEDYGGTVEKNTGDGLMVYFEDNGGIPPGPGCKRAVACALTMLDTTEKLINPILVNSGIEPINFRIGIDYGLVTVAQIGAARRWGSLVAIGTTANIAGKMLSLAGVNEILLGHRAFDQLPPDWREQYCVLHTLNSGWVYDLLRLPYPVYRYFGRWNVQT